MPVTSPLSNFKFITGANYGEGSQVLNPLIQELVEQAQNQVGLDLEIEKYGFVMDRAYAPSSEFSSILGPQAAVKFAEDESVAMRTLEQGYSKGYKIENFGLKFRATKQFVDWLRNGAVMENASESLKQALMTFKDRTQDLVYSITLAMNEEATKVYASGFSITSAFGPGSAGADGKALFASDHPIKKTGGTFSNLAAGALTSANLLSAIQQLKTGVKLGNGRSPKTASVYTLLVPRTLETTARIILNSTSSQAGMFAGTGSNANLLNQFNFEGSMIELVVLETLNELGGDDTVIGGANAGTMWFLLNKPAAVRAKAFRLIELTGTEMKMWEDDETDANYNKIVARFCAEHIDAAPYVIGYAGA